MERKINSKNNFLYRDILILFLKFNGWIIGPILISFFFGSWLDKRFDTEPWLLLVSVMVALFVSVAGLVKETLIEYKRIDSSFLDKAKKNKSNGINTAKAD